MSAALTAHPIGCYCYTHLGVGYKQTNRKVRVGMEQQISEAPTVRRRGRPSYPDWTEEQMDILRQVQVLSAGNTQVKWAQIFRDHPTWKPILLQGGRPISHLWHVSRNITSGQAILPRPGMSKVRIKAVARRGGRRRKMKAWWVEKGLPHPGIAAAKRRRENGGAELPAPASVVTDSINYCPKCGHSVAQYRRADAVLEVMKHA